jgi:BirA family transcriptional regulator, biotin operon repressor / biotin---[acetyl-CoA-carboxylase] ligase
MEAARVLIQQERMASWSSVLALHQTAGRGQRQRSWISPAGNIYGTWYWTFTTSAASENLLKYRHIASLLAGAILVSAFREMGVDVRLKWPNDIILNDRKLCGILVEDREGRMLVGIGANLVWAPGSDLLGDDFVLPATSLEASAHVTTPLCFWTQLMESGKKRLDEITAHMTPETFLERLEKDLAWIGRDIRIRTEASEPYEAVLKGFAPDGGLEIMRNGNRQVIYTGTIRPL